MFGCSCRPRKHYSNARILVELFVYMGCENCENRVRRAISKVNGVDSLEIDMKRQKVRVMGYDIEQRKILNAVRRTGRKAELWPGGSMYLDEPTYNYYRHHQGFNDYFPHQNYSNFDHQIMVMFDDDNVNACMIM